MNSVLQDWVMELGLRHQGVLLTAVRGCDTAPKDDASKLFTRCYRNMILRCHCGDPDQSVSFIQACHQQEILVRFDAFRKNLDHYPHHYVMHLIHSIEIIGYYHPDPAQRRVWCNYYTRLCKGLHMNPETKTELDLRLNADEATFKEQQ